MDINREKLYIDMLQDVLLQKDMVLEDLIRLTCEQEMILKAEQFNDDSFAKLMTEKEKVLKRLDELDQGFEMIYQKVKEEIQNQKNLYQDKIKNMQMLIQRIIDKSVQLKSLEIQNQNLLSVLLSNSRNKIREFKVNNKVASNYYKSMAKLQSNESYFMDSKR